MKAERLELFHAPKTVSQQDLMLGMACSVLAASGLHQGKSFSYVPHILIPAIRHQQIKFYFDEDGRAVGYVIWAKLAEDVEMRFLAAKTWLLHDTEWNEGASAWIVDAVAKRGYFTAITRNLRVDTFLLLDRLRYLRLRKGEHRLRELSRLPYRNILRVQSA